ncbi:MAG: GNAT family N-acetyltransferase [Flavobacteriaceae bacterium]
MPLRWQTYSWDELTKEALYAVLALRADVFVVEQECAYLDPDGKDQEAIHLLVYEDQKLVGYSRIFLNKTPSVIGRVVVHPTQRRQNLGRLLMEKSISEVPAETPIFISAQERLKSFYESLGFLQSDKGYLEDGIPHIPMTLPPRNANDV